MQTCLRAGVVGVLQVDQCEWLWQISSEVRSVTLLRLQLSVRCTSIVCVCTASEIISWDIHVPLKAQAGNLCKKNLKPKSHLQEDKLKTD